MQVRFGETSENHQVKNELSRQCKIIFALAVELYEIKKVNYRRPPATLLREAKLVTANSVGQVFGVASFGNERFMAK